MGLMTLAQFRSELVFDLKNRADTGPTGVSTERQNLWVNWAYRHVGHPSIHKHRALQVNFTLTLVSGDNQYAFNPSPTAETIVGVRSVSYIQAASDTPSAFKTKLLPRDVRWLEQRSLTTGPPKIVARQGNELWLDPVPGANQAGHLLKVHAWKLPNSLAVDADTTVLESQWDEVVLLGARWRAERDLGYRDLAELTKQDFAGLINEYQEFDQLDAEDWGWAPGIAMGEHPMEEPS